MFTLALLLGALISICVGVDLHSPESGEKDEMHAIAVEDWDFQQKDFVDVR
jgi:hypothetical protein